MFERLFVTKLLSFQVGVVVGLPDLLVRDPVGTKSESSRRLTKTTDGRFSAVREGSTETTGGRFSDVRREASAWGTGALDAGLELRVVEHAVVALGASS